MDQLIVFGGEVGEAADAADGLDALVAHHFEDGLAPAAAVFGRGCPRGLGIAQGMDEPADLVPARRAAIVRRAA